MQPSLLLLPKSSKSRARLVLSSSVSPGSRSRNVTGGDASRNSVQKSVSSDGKQFNYGALPGLSQPGQALQSSKQQRSGSGIPTPPPLHNSYVNDASNSQRIGLSASTHIDKYNRNKESTPSKKPGDRTHDARPAGTSRAD